MTWGFTLSLMFFSSLYDQERSVNEVRKYLGIWGHSQIHNKHFLFVNNGVDMVWKDQQSLVLFGDVAQLFWAKTKLVGAASSLYRFSKFWGCLSRCRTIFLLVCFSSDPNIKVFISFGGCLIPIYEHVFSKLRFKLHFNSFEAKVLNHLRIALP